MSVRSASLFALLVAAACSTPTQSANEAPAPTTADPAAPSPASQGNEVPVVIDSTDECIETTSPSPDGRESASTSTKLDPARRVTAAYDGGQAIWARRYDADRRVVSLAHWVGTRFQADVSYDAQGNITEHRISYVTEPPFWTPAPSSSAGYRYANTYAATGALERSVITPLAPAEQQIVELLFTENAAGQCERIEKRSTMIDQPTIVSAEERHYDDAGRITRVDYFGTRRCAFGTPAVDNAMSSALLTYDAQGRLALRRYWCDGTNLDTEPGSVTTFEYRADGSQRIEEVNHESEGGPGPYVTERSAYCAVIDAWLGGDGTAAKPKGARCVVP